VPTIISHPAAALLHPRGTPARVVVAGVVASILPDLDVIAFRLHVPYGSTFGHRGFTHSIVFALLSAALLALIVRDRRAFLFLFFCALSHPLLDALTNGGRGVALLSPFSNQRFFFPWRPIRVSPVGRLDLRVLWSEVQWVWLPAVGLWLAWRALPKRPSPES
jgi:inner membrane protein